MGATTKRSVNGLTTEQVYERLKQPFDPSDIKWKPQTVDYKKGLAMAVAHADPRAYSDILNEVVGIDGWSSTITFTTSPYNKFIKGRKAYGDSPATEDKQIPGNKLFATVTVTIEGIGSHTSSGDCDASDENAATSAEAQAFKRACMQFGLGRYLYDLPKQMVPYDTKTGAFKQIPDLPDWAIPKMTCEDCGGQIRASQFGDKEYSASQLIANSQKKYGKNLCIDDQRKRAEEVKQSAGGRLS